MKTLTNNRGAVLIFVTVFLALMTLFIAVAIDVGWMAYVRSQGQAAVDSAALSGAGAIPDYNKDGTTDQIEGRVAAFDSKNTVMNESADINGVTTLTVDDPCPQVSKAGSATAEVVTYNSTTDCITAPATPASANGVRVTKGFSTPLFFARLLNGGNPTKIDVSGTAVIRLRPSLPVDIICNPNDYPAKCPGPVGSQKKLEFSQSPNSNDNSSFTSYFIINASAEEFQGMVENPKSIPCLTMGDPIELNNGQVDSTLQAIKKKCEALGCSPSNPWPVVLPVISSNFNPNQTSPLLGFTWLGITGIAASGNPKSISGTLSGGDYKLGWCPPHLRR